jgi:hypothetical protein
MPTIFRREWDDYDFSSWHAPGVDKTPVIESSAYDLAWTSVGRRHAMKPDERFLPLVECADRFSENKQGNKMKNIAQRSRYLFDLLAGR